LEDEMTGFGLRTTHWLVLLSLLAAVKVWAQAGPPFQTDDPTPVDLHHYEAYVFGTLDGTPVELDTVSPGFEFNWGAIPNIQLHAILPLGEVIPSNKPVYAPGGIGPSAFGVQDMELGFKWGFIKQTPHRPQIGSFTMFEIPTGSAPRGLGVGKTWYKVPLWAQKSFGPWTTYGGGGVTVFSVPGYRSYPFAGWLVQRDLGKKWTLGTEIFYHGPEGPLAPQTRPSTLIDFGGYYKFRDPGFQLLFSYGHSAVGQTENYAYLGLYWTWGKKADSDKPGDPDKPPAGAAFNRMGPPGLL